jgi:uncharacterized BrkB/YihY/UPF0761 family membrane protein
MMEFALTISFLLLVVLSVAVLILGMERHELLKKIKQSKELSELQKFENQFTNREKFKL